MVAIEAIAVADKMMNILEMQQDDTMSNISHVTGKSNERRRRDQRKSVGASGKWVPNNAAARASLHAAKKITQIEEQKVME